MTEFKITFTLCACYQGREACVVKNTLCKIVFLIPNFTELESKHRMN